MAKGFISAEDGHYYEGDKQLGDTEVPQRPDQTQRFANGRWEPDPAKQPSYRDKRAVLYRDRLGKEQGDFIKTIGDVLDVALEQLKVAAEAGEITLTPEMESLLTTRAEIKALVPKS